MLVDKLRCLCFVVVRELHKSKRHLATENTFIEDEAPESSLHEGVKDAFLPQSTMQGCQINTLDETMVYL